MAATWSCGAIPTASDDVTIASGNTVTVNVNATAQSITVVAGGTLNFASNAPPFTLNVGAGSGIQNYGTFDATNAGAIVSAATTGGIHGIYNAPTTGVIIAGAGAITATASGGLGIENRGTFTGGAGLISADSFRNGNSSASASLTVGAGGLLISTTGSTFYPTAGTIILNGNLTLSGDFASGATTYSGAGKTILTDASHTINGSVKVHNLEIAPVTAARTITVSGAVTATGTTQLNGASGKLITFAGSGSIAAFTSSYCSSSGITGITCCNPGSPNSTGTGNWNMAATWSCGAIPTASDDVTIASGNTVTVNVNATAQSITVVAGGTLNFASNAPPFTLNVGAGSGIQNYGTFDATNAGAIVSAATTGGIHGIYNAPTTGVIIAGAGAITATASGGLGIENRGTFTGGAGLISADSFRNGNSSASASLTVGAGGLLISTTGSTFYPTAGTIILNGNLTLSGDFASGATTYSGAGKTILTDASHTINGSVKVHNLEIAPVTAARTITVSGAVTATGTTQLNGASGKLITFAGSGSITAFASYYCLTSSITSIACYPKFNQTITFGPLSNKTAIDVPFAVSATASSNLAVSFAASGNCTVSGSTVTITGVGSCTITASQAGDTNDYYAATDVPQTFSITQVNQSITFTLPASAIVGDAPLTLSPTGGASGNPVTLVSTTPNVCTVSNMTLTIVGAGTCTVTADQAGNADYNAATTVTQNMTINATPVTPPPVTPPLPEQMALLVQVDGTGSGSVSTDTGLVCTREDCLANPNGKMVCQKEACSDIIDTGTKVTLTPQADSGSVFTSWGGHEDCADGEITNFGRLCIAFFQKVYDLSIVISGQGKVTGNNSINQLPGIECGEGGTDCSQSFSHGTTTYLQATPATGMNFLGWGGDCEGLRNPLAVKVVKEMKCEAQFGTVELPPVVVTPEPVVPSIPAEASTPEVSTPVVPLISAEASTPEASTPVVPSIPAEASTPEVSTPVVPSIPAEASTPEASAPVVPSIPVEASTPVVEASTPVVPSIPVEASTPVVEASTPVVVTPVVTPVPVTVTPIQSLVSTSCATSGAINQMCNYGGKTVTTLDVQGQGMISNGVLSGIMVNIGWVSNFTITVKGKLTGGVVTGYIKNFGVMLDFEFKGMSIIGGTLGGTIRNNSKVGGFFQDVTLLAGTKITGGTLKGTIKGDKKSPAVLEKVRIKKGSKLSGVKLGKEVKLEKGVVVE